MPRPATVALRLTPGPEARHEQGASASDIRAACEMRYQATLSLHRCRQALAGFQPLLTRICDRDGDSQLPAAARGELLAYQVRLFSPDGRLIGTVHIRCDGDVRDAVQNHLANGQTATITQGASWIAEVAARPALVWRSRPGRSPDTLDGCDAAIEVARGRAAKRDRPDAETARPAEPEVEAVSISSLADKDR